MNSGGQCGFYVYMISMCRGASVGCPWTWFTANARIHRLVRLSPPVCPFSYLPMVSAGRPHRPCTPSLCFKLIRTDFTCCTSKTLSWIMSSVKVLKVQFSSVFAADWFLILSKYAIAFTLKGRFFVLILYLCGVNSVRSYIRPILGLAHKTLWEMDSHL